MHSRKLRHDDTSAKNVTQYFGYALASQRVKIESAFFLFTNTYLKSTPPPIRSTPPPSCRNSAVRSRNIDGTSEHRHIHLQQPTDCNIIATHTDTTMTTLPTHANLLNYTSSSEEESSSSGKPPSNQYHWFLQ